ncbi:acyl carrier protein [Candidatus Daviesbacteria bacterium RIFCSPLOWO2_02_FULL_36_7]|uniref:Acyl carrier protein n=1 Tax=Candidatus Daviesbacteria bacterium RIFCSPLOWO2_02_FULL_36_7 TaxID=1797792 RepID=A0A1F5MHK3_9BACT|nr:MAG: acyl carrier protein [Candidatus Daviesbacteria bacterium RIFCSPLOWO2_02_FULL_36_7]
MARLEKILSKVLEVKENEIKDDSSPDNIENWDSFNGLMLISELENEFKISFTLDEITSVKTVADIKKALTKHGVKSNEL